MGAYSPSGLINKDLDKKIINKIIKPTLDSLNSLECKFKGFLKSSGVPGLTLLRN